ncbi:MAG: hypothetical protein HN457_00620 [Opitutales bacterium]|jgi:hypothetical protein|nr:hypothetical protein [Opitutales bacterium]MDG2255087.1 hypothetical protein [Opitutaceae bacterium]MBT5170490.1 hypothetical protein [Opitutales bacterium]MBT5816349.1 hypothetical protein [Opitutales bacterium]MBT6380643.1 hypothetical protein [Opitutales bacterium]
MKIQTIALLSALALVNSSTLNAQDAERPQRGQGGNRERPDQFALADKDKSGGVTLEELVNSRLEQMSRRGGQGPQRGGGQRGGGRDPAAMKAQMTERMAVVFKQADADESGELSKEEFGKMAQGAGGNRGRGGAGGQGGPRGPRGGGGA